MATVELSHDDREAALVVGDYPKPTGRLRWWKPLDGGAVLQAEWRGNFTTCWVEIPTLFERKE